MAEDTDIVRREDEQYRRGVVLGLTMAEVTILLLFCLLMTMLLTLQVREKRIKELIAVNEGVSFVVSQSVLNEVVKQFGDVQGQAEIDETFQVLLADAEKNAKVAEAIKNSNIQIDKDNENEAVDLVAVSNAAQKVVKSSQQPANNATEIIAGLERVENVARESAKSGALHDLATEKGRQAAKAAMASDICALQYPDERQQEECRKKVVEIAGGKGLEFQSCWWDKTTVPWRTKNIYEVALTDGGYILREADPGVEEYRVQRATQLPVGAISLNTELDEAVFLGQTLALRQWSEQNNCRFFVRVFDETGPNEKTIYKKRSDVLEQRFYPDKSKRRFSEDKF
jgi:hypothetical protein